MLFILFAGVSETVCRPEPNCLYRTFCRREPNCLYMCSWNCLYMCMSVYGGVARSQERTLPTGVPRS